MVGNLTSYEEVPNCIPFSTAQSIGEPVYYELLRQQDLYIMDIDMLNDHQELR